MMPDQGSPKPNLLFLTQRLPYPPIKGEKIRPFQILTHLARSHAVHLGCLIDDPSDTEHIPVVAALCRDIHVASIDRRMARILCTTGLLTNEALSVVFFRDRGLARWVSDVVTRVRPDVVFVNSSNMAPYVLDLPRTGVRIVDLADVDSEKWRSYAETTTGLMRFVYRREWQRVAALERRIAYECDASTFVSEAEASLFRSLIPERAAHIHGISSGVDHRYFDPSSGFEAPYDPGRPTYVFTGTMDYPPNVDAVRWFANAMLPIIRRTLPDAAFYIVGNSPSPAVQALTAIPDVHVTGRVPDVRPYLAHATAGVAPMRIARGIQNKVLEAMSMARPVIVTSGALEGIEAEPGVDVILANSEAAFAEAACRMARDPAAAAIGQAARARVVTSYDWSVRLSRFDDLLHPERRAASP